MVPFSRMYSPPSYFGIESDAPAHLLLYVQWGLASVCALVTQANAHLSACNGQVVGQPRSDSVQKMSESTCKDTSFHTCRTFLATTWAAANGGVTNGGLRGVWPPFLEIGRNRPFPALFALFRRVRRAPGKSRKRRKKAFFLRYPQICLNPHLLNPHLRHPKLLRSGSQGFPAISQLATADLNRAS